MTKQPNRLESARGRIALGAGAAILGLCGFGMVMLHAAASPQAAPQVDFPEAPAAVLAKHHLVLVAPTTAEQDSVSVSAQAAQTVALEGRPGTIRGVKLAHVDQAPDAKMVGCLCWVVSVLPPNGLLPHGGPAPQGNLASSASTAASSAMQVAYLLVFVDAKTGQLHFSQAVGTS